VKKDLNRWLPLVNGLCYPHYIVLFFSVSRPVLYNHRLVAILFTGKYPRGIFDFVVVFTGGFESDVICFMLITDKYPHSAWTDIM